MLQVYVSVLIDVIGFFADGTQNTSGGWYWSNQQNKGKYPDYVEKKSYSSQGK